MADVLAHYHMFNFRARCAVAVTTDLVRDAQRRHGLDPITTIALGRALTGVALLASSLKAGKEYVHCAFSGKDSPLAKVVAECNGDGECRGFTSPARLELSPGGTSLANGAPVPGTVGEALGPMGVLSVTRGQAGERLPYTAFSAFENGEIASDIARYLTDSEQIPSAVAAGVKLDAGGGVVAAGGILVQRLGGAVLEEGELQALESRVGHGLHISERIAAGEGTEQILAYLQGAADGFGLLAQRPLVFRCSCSRERMADALSSLGEAQLREIERDVGAIEARCHYCSTTHGFRLEALIAH